MSKQQQVFSESVFPAFHSGGILAVLAEDTIKQLKDIFHLSCSFGYVMSSANGAGEVLAGGTAPSNRCHGNGQVGECDSLSASKADREGHVVHLPIDPGLPPPAHHAGLADLPSARHSVVRAEERLRTLPPAGLFIVPREQCEAELIELPPASPSFMRLISDYLPPGPVRDVVDEFGAQILSGTIDVDRLKQLLGTSVRLTHNEARNVQRGIEEIDALLKPYGISFDVSLAGDSSRGYRMFDVSLAQSLNENEFGSVLSVDRFGSIYSKEINVPSFRNPFEFTARLLKPEEAAQNLAPLLSKALHQGH